MPINVAFSQGEELSVDALDGSGGQFLTSEWLYGQTGCRGGHGQRSKKAAKSTIVPFRVLVIPQKTNADGRPTELR